MRQRPLLLIGLLVVAVSLAPDRATAEPASLLPACAPAIARAAQLPLLLLAAVVQVESQGDPWTIHVNATADYPARTYHPASHAEAVALLTRLWAAGWNVDVGLGQLNSRTARRYGLTPAQLLDPCHNLWATAWHLREKIARYGYSWVAIERYNGNNRRYPWRVFAALQRLRAQVEGGITRR
jgi:type IV secretion system protein VirB1